MDEISTFESVQDMTETICDQDLIRTAWIALTSTLIFTFGMLGNVTTVYIYTRSKKLRENKMFELILAAFDIYAMRVTATNLHVQLVRQRRTERVLQSGYVNLRSHLLQQHHLPLRCRVSPIPV